MAGIANKIGETLNVGGGKKEGEKSHDERKSAPHGDCKAEQIKPGQQGERKEGFMDKIKDKIPGEGGHEKCETKEKKTPHGDCKAEQIKPGQQGERKEGFMDKIKDKIPGEGGHEKCETKEKKKSGSD